MFLTKQGPQAKGDERRYRALRVITLCLEIPLYTSFHHIDTTLLVSIQ